MNKYELTDETLEHNGHTLHRIKALKDFGDVKKGDLGGWIESEDNLSQEGDCWIYNDAKVYGKVFGNAQVYGNAFVMAFSEVCGDAKVCGETSINELVQVYGDGEKLYYSSISKRLKDN